MRGKPGDKWNIHRGGPSPVSPTTKVRIRYRNGVICDEVEAGHRRWERWPADVGEGEWDITAWPADDK
jgi:hypothetical protein